MPYRFLVPFIAMLPRLEAEEMQRNATIAWTTRADARKQVLADLERRAGRTRAAGRRQIRGRDLARAFGQMGIPVQRTNTVSAAAVLE